MSGPAHDDGAQDRLVQGVRLHEARHRRRLHDDQASVARRLAQIGVLGWVVVVPILAAILAGRWLDQRFASGIAFTAPMLMLGAAFGCWSAWRWMQGP